MKNFFFPYCNFPTVFAEGITYQEQLCYIVKKFNELSDIVNKHSSDIPKIYELCKELSERIEKLENDFNSLIDGSTILNIVKQKIDECIKMVFFGLTDDGYFCAYIPSSWAQIKFDTIMDCDSENFGKLIIKY